MIKSGARMKNLIEVIWMDATEGGFSRGNFEEMKPEEFLIERKSYGELYIRNNKAIVLLTTKDEDGIEYIAIPNKCIKKVYKK